MKKQRFFWFLSMGKKEKHREKLVGLTETGPFMRKVCADFVEQLPAFRRAAEESELDVECKDFPTCKGGNVVSLHVKVFAASEGGRRLILEYWPGTGSYLLHVLGIKGVASSPQEALGIAVDAIGRLGASGYAQNVY